MAEPERDRVEDVFQDEIIKAIVDIVEFKQFARSKYGLCLDEDDIRDIIANYQDSVVEQKMELLSKWREKEGSNATADKIRSLVTGYRTGSQEGYVSLNKGMYGVYKSESLCGRVNVFLGEQISRITGVKLRAIKLVHYGKDILREAQVLTTLGTHENVVTTIHADEYYGDPYKYVFIVMELSWTQHLHNVLKECIELQITFEESTAMDLALQILKGLVFIHDHDIIHRDVKCENMLISEDKKHLKITDFGISKIITQGQCTKITSDVGTDRYRAPETYIKASNISQKSDIFSTGISFGEIFSSGKHPYGDDPDLWTYNIKNDKNLDLSKLLITSYINPAKTLLKKMLQHEAEMRPTAEEALEEFSHIPQNKEDLVPSSESNQQSEPTVDPVVQLSDYSLQEEEMPTATANAIVLTNRQDNHMYSFKPSEPSTEWKKLHKIPSVLYTAVTVRHCIYSLHNKEVQRLFYSPMTEWTRVANLKKDHGPDPPVTVCNGSIHVCGGSEEASTSVERYEEQYNAWITLPDLNEARQRPCVAATKDHVYCIGGRNEGELLRSVERFDGVKWDYVKDAPRNLFGACATLLEQKIYVADRRGVICYSIPNNSWKTLELTAQWPFDTPYLKILSVENILYLVGPTIHLGYDYSEMYSLDPESENMTRIKQFKDKRLYVHSSIALNLA